MRSEPPSTNSSPSIDPAVERAVLKRKCERDHLFFGRYFFKHRQAIKFRVNWHHVLIADTVQRVTAFYALLLIGNFFWKAIRPWLSKRLGGEAPDA